MAGIIPLNNYQLNRKQAVNTTSKNRETKKSYDVLYEDIASRANEVGPNEAKARIVKNTPITFVTSPIKDTFKDMKNFTKAASTGRISDNNLGRINDLGLKAGALLIASFLATRSKTATNAIMQFVGGGAFLASMSLWPKIFINLPARLVHGFPIDQKYISAQGDKKEVFLDNQFIPLDAIKEEDKRKYAKRAGIDYDSKNGKEKIERKMQKAALQNRTLALLTASLGVPLMTSLSCSEIEPFIYNRVVEHNYNDAKTAISPNMKNWYSLIKPETRHQEEVKELLNSYKSKKVDDSFFNNLAKLLQVDDVFKDFVDPDDLVAVKKFSTYNVTETLKDIYYNNSYVNMDEVTTKLKQAAKEYYKDEEALNATIAEFRKSLKDERVVTVYEGAKKLSLPPKALDSVFESLEKNQSDNFFRYIEYFNNEVLGQTRARLKAYLNVMNPVVGAKSESVYTREYADVMKKLFKSFKLPYKSKDKNTISLKDLAKAGSDEECGKLLSQIFSKKVSGITYGSEEYAKLLEEFTFKSRDKDLSKVVGYLKQDNNLEAIIADAKTEGMFGDVKSLGNAIFGGTMKENNALTYIKNFIRRQEIDLNATKNHAIICANFETRLLNGSFEQALKDCGLLTTINIKDAGKDTYKTFTPLTFEQLKEAARNVVYDGKFSRIVNGGMLLSNDAVFNDLRNVIYDKDAFSFECKNIEGFEETLTSLRENVKDFLEGGNPKDSNARAASFAYKIKDQAAKLYNNKSWARIFTPIAIILVISTLLIQPFFGNIKNEFPEDNNEKGGKK